MQTLKSDENGYDAKEYERIYNEIKAQLADKYYEMMSSIPITTEDRDEYFVNCGKFDMVPPPPDGSVFKNEWGAVCMNMVTYNGLKNAAKLDTEDHGCTRTQTKPTE